MLSKQVIENYISSSKIFQSQIFLFFSENVSE